MAVTQNTYTGNGSTTNYSFTFPYLEETDIKVTLNGTLTTAYTLANATTISFTTAPGAGVAIRIYRDTDTDNLQSTFFAGSAIRAQDLNDNFLQSNYTVQEVKSRYLDRTGGTMSGQLDMGNNKIVNLATPTANGDAATKAYVDTVISAGIADGDKGDITVSGAGTAYTIDNGVITNAKVNASAAIDGTKINPDFGSQSVTTTGNVLLDNQADLRFGEATGHGGNWVAFQAPGTIASNVTWTLPDADGSNGQLLGTNGTGTLSWQSALKSADIGVTVQGYDADTAKLDVAQTFTARVSSTERTITTGAFDLSTGNFWTCGAIAIPNPTNQVAGTSGLIRVTAAPTSFASNFKFPSGSYTAPSTFPAIVPFYVQASGTILMGKWTEGIA